MPRTPPKSDLLLEEGARSDEDVFTIIIESLMPVRGHAMETSTSETVGQLKQRYLAQLGANEYALSTVETGHSSHVTVCSMLAPTLSLPLPRLPGADARCGAFCVSPHAVVRATAHLITPAPTDI